ncbi:hypothetical protein Tco_1136227 [Tanacetum coccineum]
MSPEVYNMGTRRKRKPYGGIPAQEQQVPSPPQWPVHLEVATRQQDRHFARDCRMFPEDFAVLGPSLQLETGRNFQIDLVPGAAHRSSSTQTTGPSENEEFQTITKSYSDKEGNQVRLGRKEEEERRLVDKAKLCMLQFWLYLKGAKDLLYNCDASHKGWVAVF